MDCFYGVSHRRVAPPRGGRLNRLRTLLSFRGISREIPYSRNDDTRTRITDQANTLNATVIARSAATWQSPGREDLLAYTDKILARTGSVPRRPTRLRWLTAEKSPAVETKTIVHEYHNALASAGSLPYTIVISSVSREIPYNRNENKRTRIPGYSPAGDPCRRC